MTSNVTKWVRTRLVLFALLVCASFAVSQLSPSSAQGARVENYSIESGTQFEWNTGSYIGGGYDYPSYMNLPFAFEYDGVMYPAGSPIIISPDGWVSLDVNTYYEWWNYDYGNLGNPSYANKMYVAGHDMYTSGMYWRVSGSSGQRVLTITWWPGYDLPNWWYSNYFSIKLYEKDYAIAFSYAYEWNWFDDYGTVSIGLNGHNNQDGFSSLYYQNEPYVPGNFKMRPPKPDVPAMTVSTSHIQFDNLELGIAQTLCLTVTNTGTQGEPGGSKTPLVIGTPEITGSPAEFSVVSGPSANNLDIGESAEICVQFIPNWPYTRTSTLTVPTINANTEKVTLAGRGVAPEMAFETEYLFRKTKTKLEHSIEESFWIKSTGLGPLTITDLVLGGDYPSQYEIVERPMAPIPPGDSGLVTVRLTPHYEGLKTARLTVKSNGFLNKEQVVHLFGLGILPRLVVTPGVVAKDSIAMGDSMMYTIRLENIGSDTVNILQHFMAFADRDFTFYGLSGMDTAIPPERFKDIFVTFKPTTRGHRQARIRVLTDIPLTYEPNPRDTSIFEVDVFGTGVPYGLMSVESGAMLDSAIVGEQVCQTVKIWNNGQLSLTVNSIDVLGSDASDFTFSGVTFPLTIQPQSSVDVQVCATPSERGIRAASLSVNAVSSDKTTTVELPLEVYGLLACASPDVNAAFNEEIIRVGTSSTASIVITNCGDVPTSFTAAINGAAYALSGAATSPVIAPGATHTFDVTYNASAMMPQPGQMTVTASQSGINDMVIDLAGTGGNSMLAATGTNVTSGGAPVDFDVTVLNSGNMEWIIGTPEVTAGEFTLRTSPTSIAANNGSDKFGFTYTPQQGGTGRATVTFPGSDNNTFSFVLNGQTASVNVVASNGYELRQNFPNPFADASTIAFTMAEAGNAIITITDITGNTVATVANGFFGKGDNTVSFDASTLPSGNYFFELTVGPTRLQRPMTIKK